jgi:4-amino-4-deoxy-L-arabinose transferase-like glycosyltransferase
MTHTTLVVFAAAGTLYQTMRLMDKQTFCGYLVWGLFFGIGFMAKANFALFLVTLCLTLCTLREGRKVLLNWKILLSLLVLFAMCGNYFYWMYSNQDIVFSATGKFKRAVDDYYIKGTLSLIRNSFLFLTPLWLFYLIFFPYGYDVKWWEERTIEQKFIGRYIAFVFVVLLLVVLLFKVTYVKDRWMQPLLFAAPLFFFSRVESAKLTLGRTGYFLILTAVAAVIIYSAFTIRVVGASYIQRFCRMNYPFTAMAEDIRSAGFENGLIISNNRFLAGNMHFQFPESPAIIPGYHFEKLEETSAQQQGVVIWRAEESTEIPEKLGAFLEDEYRVPLTEQKIHFYEHTYKYGRTETITLAVMYVGLAQK